MTLKLRSSKTNREGSYWFVYPQSIENSCATRVNTQCKNEKEMALKIPSLVGIWSSTVISRHFDKKYLEGIKQNYRVRALAEWGMKHEYLISTHTHKHTQTIYLIFHLI